MPGDRKVSVGAVDLDAYPSHMSSTPVLAPWQHEGLCADPDADARTTRGDLGVGGETIDPVLGPRIDVSGLLVTDVVEINPNIRVIERDSAADAIGVAGLVVSEGSLLGGPRRGMSGIGLATGLRIQRNLGP